MNQHDLRIAQLNRSEICNLVPSVPVLPNLPNCYVMLLFVMCRYLFVAYLFVLLSACAYSQEGTSSNSVSERLSFPDPETEFNQYRHKVLEYLKISSLPSRSEADIRLNLPFEMSASKDVSYRGKFLLFHGLSDSPFVWTDLARVMSERGFDVRAILLPGHGSHPRQLLDISYQRWLTAARKQFELWHVDDTPLYLGGFSLGGVIATILALEQPDDIAGLFLVSPAYHSKLDSLLRWSWLYAWFKPWMFGGLIYEDNPVKYNSIPINSGTQYYRTTQYLKNQWSDRQLSIPVLIISSLDDSVVDVEYSRRLFQKNFSSPDRKMLIYSNDKSIIEKPNEVIRRSAYLGRRILNQSHLSLVNSPNNPLFGINGRILVCNGNEYPIFMACMNSKRHWYGAQHTPSPDGVAVARTTYNPDFNSVFDLFDQVFTQ